MALPVRFYNLSKPENSTKRPAADAVGLLLNCVLKGPCSKLSPRLEVQFATNTGSAPTYNYAYIEEFSRYYWVTNWEYDGRLWIAYLDVDPLATFKSTIGNTDLYILRSSAAQNGSIRDDMYPVTGDITTDIFIPGDAPWWTINQETGVGGSYVVGVISGQSVIYYAMTSVSFGQFCEKVLDPTLSNYAGSSLDIGTDLAKMIFRPFEYITSVTYIPVSMANLIGAGTDYVEPDVNTWRVGFWTLTGVALFPIKKAKTYTATKRLTIPKHPKTAARGKYLNAPPFTELYLSLPRLGYVPLDTSTTCDLDYIDVTVHIDIVTGEAYYSLAGWRTGYNAGIILGRYSAQLGVAVQLAQDGLTISNAIDAATNAAAGIVSAAESPLAAAGSVSSITRIFEPHISTLGNYGGFIDMQAGTCALAAVFRDVTADDNDHQGRPLMAVRKPLALGGYMKVLDGTVEDVIATREELRAIRGYLETGFYYE